MYICSCYAVTDGQIKKAVEDGTRTFRQLCRELRCCTQCGICARYAKEVFDEAKAAKKTSESEVTEDTDSE